MGQFGLNHLGDLKIEREKSLHINNAAANVVPFSLSLSKVHTGRRAVEIKGCQNGVVMVNSSGAIFNIVIVCLCAYQQIDYRHLTPVVNIKTWSYCSRAAVRSIWARPSDCDDYKRLMK